MKLLCRDLSMVSKPGSVPVYLNVYDLTPINGYAYWFGLGIYHSGVQVHGVEYAYGAHDAPTTGIFECGPRECPGFTFRKSVPIGRTNLGSKEVRSLMDKLSSDRYTGNTYHLIRKNCNHFCNDVCVSLTGNNIPRWVNRLARLGSICHCVLPNGLHAATVPDQRRRDQKINCDQVAGDVDHDQRRKLRISKSARFSFNSYNASSSSSTFAVPDHSAASDSFDVIPIMHKANSLRTRSLKLTDI